jgi:alpha-glucosidase
VGRDLLVAPVVRPGQVSRRVWLPRGAWLSLPEIDACGATVEGGRDVIAEAPLGRIPMYLRAGGAVPLTDPAPHTTSASWSKVSWIVHAGAGVAGSLYEDAGDGEGPWRRTVLGGSRDGAALVIERTIQGDLPAARASETMIVAGAGGARVEGARSRELAPGVLVLDVPVDSPRLVIR